MIVYYVKPIVFNIMGISQNTEDKETNQMKKHVFDLIIVTDEHNLLKDKKQTVEQYQKVKQGAYNRLCRVLTSMKPKNTLLN
tara:strand:+ start:182 stop:427 length:246 start_codon:yes stop_codon:yes gene_type:complete